MGDAMRKLVVSLAMISMALAVTTYTLWRDRSRESARADAQQVRLAVLESQHATRSASPIAESAAVQVAARAPVLQTAAGTSGADATVETDDYVALRRRMLRDPKYYEIERASMRPNFALRRAELIRVLGVSPAQADAIVDYWIDRQLRSEARVLPEATTEQEGLEVAELVSREQREDEERLHAILGEELFPKMQDYIASHPSRNRAKQLRDRLADGGDALRDDQVEPLIGALHAEQERLQQELQDLVSTLDPDVNASVQASRKMEQRIMDIHKVSNRRIHSSAAAILSPRQLSELDAMLRSDFEVMQAQGTLRRMEANAGEN